MPDDRPRILLVEDDPDFAAFMLVLLERQGYAVHCANAASAGLRMLADRDIDLVITDIVMPEMDGIEFLQSLPARARGVPVVAVTGSPLNVNGTLSRVMHALGAVQVLDKPVAPADLVSVVRGALADKTALNQTA